MISKKLLLIIEKITDSKIDEVKFQKTSKLIEDFGFDSVAIVELIVAVETEFDIYIEDDDLDLEKINSIDTLLKLIKGKIQKKDVV